ncbi:hypothetical protein GXB81_25870 [Paraburkholderia sp. Ac-20336]|uniref:hypothetical protein n=1 Tax=Paraburkholderia sp. Ac-20336 TaxID=2703886 RepID=UPI0019823FDA|nr:hypothetical protein [Paraburkholderia sp. Ac-20336]MBN3806456.1 hypothetical protein [Paraburkholderia sp. Ac-20336]
MISRTPSSSVGFAAFALAAACAAGPVLAQSSPQAASLPAPAAQPAPLSQADTPAYVVGEKWTFKYENALDPSKNSTYTQAVSNVGPGRVELNQGATVLDANGNIVKLGATSYEPSDGKLRFPMHVGDAWSGSYSYKTGSWEAIGQRRSKVVDVELVETAAGSFQAFRIEQSVAWSAGGGNRGEGQTREVDWYAPAVGRIVKLDYTDQATHAAPTTTHVELVGFTKP